MKTLIPTTLAITLLALSSCAVRSAHFVADIGRDVKKEEFKSKTTDPKTGAVTEWSYKVTDQDESTSTKTVATAGVAGYGIHGYTSIEKGKQAADVAISGQNTGVKEKIIEQNGAIQKKALDPVIVPDGESAIFAPKPPILTQ